MEASQKRFAGFTKATVVVVAIAFAAALSFLVVPQAAFAADADAGTSGDLVAAPAGSSEAVNPGTATTNNVVAKEPKITYRVQYKSKSWDAWKQNGALSGAKGNSQKITGVSLKLKDASGEVQYRTKAVGGKWQAAKRNGAKAGTSAGVECLTISLTGNLAKTYDVYYRTQVKGYGWQTWRMNGQTAGTPEKGARITGLEVNLVPKTATSFKARTGKVSVYSITNANVSDLVTNVSSNKMKVFNVKGNIQVPYALHPGSNTVINATGKTIKVANNYDCAIANMPSKTNYKDVVNLTVRGGTWSNAKIGLDGHSMFRISHASNVELLDLTIKDGYEQHAVELIACKNVDMCKVKLLGQGKCPSDCTNDQLQIDLADQVAAPNIGGILGKKAWTGAPSKGIYVYACTMKGARGIGANWAYKTPSHSRAANYHSNITIKNCTLTGKTAEALSLFNTKSATVTGCKITTNAPLSRDAYSIGAHVAYMDGSGPAAKSSNKITITNNTVKGGRQAVQAYSHNGAKFGTVVIANNKLYCKNGADEAIHANDDQALSLSVYGNSTHGW